MQIRHSGSRSGHRRGAFRRSRTLWLVLLLVVAGLVTLVALGVVRRAISRQAMRPYADYLVRPDDWGLQAEEHWIARRGAALHVWTFRAHDPRGTLVLSTGNSGNKQLYLPLVDGFLARGWSVALWDFRGYGLSDGDPDLFGLVDDAVAVLDGATAGPVALFGPSLGSLVALGVAERRPDRVFALVLESAFLPTEVARQRLGGTRARLARWLSPASLRAIDRCARLPQPMLFLHGRLDTLTPLDGARRMMATCEAPDRFRAMWVAPTSGHAPAPSGQYARTISALVDEVLGAALAAETSASLEERLGVRDGVIDRPPDPVDAAAARLRALAAEVRAGDGGLRLDDAPQMDPEGTLVEGERRPLSPDRLQRIERELDEAWHRHGDALQPWLMPAWYRVGWAWEWLGRSDRAAVAYRQALERLPQQPERAIRYLDAGWWIGLGELIERTAGRLSALADDPDERRAWERTLVDWRRRAERRTASMSRWRRELEARRPAS